MALTKEQKKYLEAKRVVVEYERKYPQHPFLVRSGAERGVKLPEVEEWTIPRFVFVIAVIGGLVAVLWWIPFRLLGLL